MEIRVDTSNQVRFLSKKDFQSQDKIPLVLKVIFSDGWKYDGIVEHNGENVAKFIKDDKK